MKKYTVYILRTNKGTLYTGQTDNLEKRLEKHRNGKGAKYLRSFDHFNLVYVEEYDSKTEALKREYEIKRMTKANKESLVAKTKCLE